LVFDFANHRFDPSMSVHLQMLGRQLPCNLLDLLRVKPLPLPLPVHDDLADRAARGERYPDVLYRLGLSHLGRQELGLARKHLTEAIALKPGYVAARVALAVACDLLARHAEAVEQIDAVLGTVDAKVDRTPLACAAGFCMERLGAPGAAAFRYEQALADSVDGESDMVLFAHYRLAAIYLAHNELANAAEHHGAILEIEPQEQTVRTSLAHLLQLLGRHKEAVWEYEKALCMEPDSWELQLELAEQLQRMGDGERAVAHLRRLVGKHPEFPDLRLRLANLHSSRGEDEAARAQYEAALAVHPNYLDCHIALGRHELRMGRTQRALVHFQEAMGVNDQNVEAYAGMAVALNQLGRTQESEEMLSAARRIAGNSDVLLSQLGRIEMEARAAAQAEAAFDPQQEVLAVEEPAETQAQRQWLESQVERYEAILERHPTWADVRVRCGMLHKLLGRPDRAMDCFERAARENPAYVEAWVQLGLVRQQVGDARGAMGALEMAVQIRPQYADLHYRLGLIYCGEMEFDLAMERFEEAVSLNRENPDFQRQLWAALEGMQMRGRRGAGARRGSVAALGVENA
jgi:tetratricopeptide (TPR) repeat protein